MGIISPLNNVRKCIDLALSEGREYGRPATTMSSTFRKNYRDWKSGKIKAVDFMKLEHLKKTTFYKLVKEYENM